MIVTLLSKSESVLNLNYSYLWQYFDIVKLREEEEAARKLQESAEK